MSYGLTVDLLKNSFPIDEKLSIETVRKNTLNIAEKINGLLGEEKHISNQNEKPKRHLFEVLESQGIKDSEGGCFMSDGGESLKNLQTHINPNAKHILEWFHITMKITVLKQYVKGVTNIDEQAVFA